MSPIQKLQVANELLSAGVINTPEDYMAIINMRERMKELSIDAINYFIANERQLFEYINSSDQYTGYQLFQGCTPKGEMFPFTRIDFLLWQNNKEIYNSPLYKALHE